MITLDYHLDTICQDTAPFLLLPALRSSTLAGVTVNILVSVTCNSQPLLFQSPALGILPWNVWLQTVPITMMAIIIWVLGDVWSWCNKWHSFNLCCNFKNMKWSVTSVVVPMIIHRSMLCKCIKSTLPRNAELCCPWCRVCHLLFGVWHPGKDI